MRITLPHVGESVTEAVIERWLKQVGDRVEKYEPLAEVVTDKVSMEMPSPVEGILTEILVDAGQTLAMGTEIAEIATDIDEASPAEDIEPGQASSPPQAIDRIGTLVKDATNVGPTGSGGPITTGVESGPPPTGARHSPAVLRLAELHNVDLALVSGTGHNGRVTRKDVQAHIDATKTGAEPESQSRSEDVRVPLTAIRRMIAENMKRSVSEIPEAWSSMEVDMTNVMSARERAKDDFERREGARLTPLAFALKAVAESLRANSIVNSTWAHDAIILKGHINLGVAIATERGLLVPVVSDADRLSVAELAESVDNLASKARENKLNIEDVQGGTFTVNNTGALGSVTGKGIINHPQAAILNTESIVKRPVIIDDAIAIRSMMNICLTFDHRIMDGREAGAFLADVKRRLECVDPNADI
ncbi:MAG: dihydrolipoamide acetyltransferase family protein [Chloroflexi bacterium]|nr:dihydrolipoamide acetyltransferase family protein [Chloroflexota bacterium]